MISKKLINSIIGNEDVKLSSELFGFGGEPPNGWYDKFNYIAFDKLDSSKKLKVSKEYNTDLKRIIKYFVKSNYGIPSEKEKHLYGIFDGLWIYHEAPKSTTIAIEEYTLNRKIKVYLAMDIERDKDYKVKKASKGYLSGEECVIEWINNSLIKEVNLTWKELLTMCEVPYVVYNNFNPQMFANDVKYAQKIFTDELKKSDDFRDIEYKLTDLNEFKNIYKFKEPNHDSPNFRLPIVSCEESIANELFDNGFIEELDDINKNKYIDSFSVSEDADIIIFYNPQIGIKSKRNLRSSQESLEQFSVQKIDISTESLSLIDTLLDKPKYKHLKNNVFKLSEDKESLNIASYSHKDPTNDFETSFRKYESLLLLLKEVSDTMSEHNCLVYYDGDFNNGNIVIKSLT